MEQAKQVLKQAEQAFKNYKYSGIYIYAYTDPVEGKITKHTDAPSEKFINTRHYIKPIWNAKTRQCDIIPNAIQIDTKDYYIIDIDVVDACPILDKLLKDCNFIIKTRKGYHFYFNNCNDIKTSVKGKKKVLAKIADFGLEKMFYCPEYVHIETGEKFHYSIHKTGELNDMPNYAIEWCNTVIEKFNEEAIKKKKWRNY